MSRQRKKAHWEPHSDDGEVGTGGNKRHGDIFRRILCLVVWKNMFVCFSRTELDEKNFISVP